MGYDNIICNQSARNKSTLISANDVRQSSLNPVSNGLSDELEGDIAEGYGSEVTKLSEVVNFWY
jgi:hypothetical protein